MSRSLLLLASLLLTSHVFADSLRIENAWSPEAPPTARVMAGYMVIHNPGNQELLIEKVSSPQFKSVEMHRTLETDGMYRMEWQLHIHVPPGEPTLLEPGAKHLMLINPVKPLKAGDSIELTLHLSNQQTQTVIATVRKP
ncbi:MAG: copper chaperone PCu(A)C [Gammaproteobacteria bacterium]